MPNALAGLMPLVKSAADVVAAFNGSAGDVINNAHVRDALEIIGAAAPLVDSFSRGIEISPEDVREALVGMDRALSDFDAEIARQGG